MPKELVTSIARKNSLTGEIGFEPEVPIGVLAENVLMSDGSSLADRNGVEVFFGKCITAGDIESKEVICPELKKLKKGVVINVHFRYTNTATSPTLNVNNLGDVSLYQDIYDVSSDTSIGRGMGKQPNFSWNDG